MSKEEPRLHHCTNFDSLRKILESKHFRPSFCLEQSDFMNVFCEGAYAVVCFADLLNEELSRHMKSFKSNSYIVMNKNWANNNLVSPVVYYYPNTIPSAFMKNWCEYILKKNSLEQNTDSSNELPVKNTYIMFAFMKQYKGSYFDKKKKRYSDKTCNFFLEREWRWIPHVTHGEAYYLPKEDYMNDEIQQRELNRLIEHQLVLKFNYDDVLEIGVPFDKVCLISKLYPELSNKIKYIKP